VKKKVLTEGRASAKLERLMKTYTFKNGVTITSRFQPCGTFYAMGGTHIEEEKVFDVNQNEKLLATVETWGEAKKMVSDILSGKKAGA
jgi:hypothetical protein